MSKTIDKVESVDIHIDFIDEDKFKLAINGGESVDGDRIATNELRVIARTLTRISLGMWNEIDNAYLGISETK